MLDPLLVVEPGGHRYFEPSRCLMSTVPHRVGRATRPLATYLADRVLFADRGARRACRGQLGRAGLRVRVHLRNCTFFQTSIAFRPTLQAQHDHAASHGLQQRADLFQRLLNDLNENQAS
jgi:hypothetical protein